MKRRIVFIAFLLAILGGLLMPLPIARAEPQTIDDSFNITSWDYPQTRKVGVGAGRIWVFYIDSDWLCFKSSTDGTTWSTITQITHDVPYGSEDMEAAIYIGGLSSTHIHLAYLDNLFDPHYRRGVLNTNGTITWGNDYEVYGANNYGQISVSCNSEGYPFVGASYHGANTGLSAVWNCGQNDGTWLTSTANTLKTRTASGKHFHSAVSLLDFTDGKMAAVYCLGATDGADLVYVRDWDDGWGGEVSTTIYANSQYWSATSHNDVAYIAIDETTTGDIEYLTWSTASGMSAATTLHSGAAVAPQISFNTDNDDLAVFFGDHVTADHWALAYYDSSEDGWVIDSDWFYETLTIIYPNYTSSLPRAGWDWFGLAYVASSAVLRYAILSTQFHVDTLAAECVSETSEEVNGDLTEIGWGTATERGFYLNTDPSTGNSSGNLQIWYEEGSFTTGAFSHIFTDLVNTERYYFIAYVHNSDFYWGEWLGFYAGATQDFLALTEDPSDIKATEAKFNGEIVEVPVGKYATFYGFDWGLTQDPTWSWESEAGSYTSGTTFHHYADLSPDEIYYVRAKCGNDSVTDYGGWVGFITLQQTTDIETGDEEGAGLIPPNPDEPSGWIRDPKDWGTIGVGDALIPMTFFVFCVLTGFIVLIGLALTKYVKSFAVLFMVCGFILGLLCFWPKGGYWDWWIMLPYILVGWALLTRQKDTPMAE